MSIVLAKSPAGRHHTENPWKMQAMAAFTELFCDGFCKNHVKEMSKW